MTPLRAKYIRDLVIRGRSKNTQEAYTRCVCDLARYYRRSPELISYEEVTGWLHHLIKERRLSASSVNIAVSAVRFLYAVTLGRERVDLMASVPHMKRATGRAEVYAHSEVEAILTAPRQPRGRPMTPLRAKYIRDLVIRGRSKNTQEAYTRCVCDLARYYRRSPELISYEEVTGWLHHLIKERQLAASSVNIAVSAVRFLYALTLGRERVDLMASVPHMKRDTGPAEAYARSEVEAILTAPRQPRSRPMTALRAKYIRDLVIRGRSKNTQEAYTRCVCDLAGYYRRSPELISYEEVTGWLHHLIKERQLAASRVNIAVSAVRFLYAVTLGRERVDLMASVPHMKRATPVALERKSVVEGFKLKLHEDEPSLNPTLLELLRLDFGITIQALEHELPRNEDGLDVAKIWRTIRAHIRDLNGWELVENVVLSTFSFTKYLMWKDLQERTDALKENAIVKHLIETPTCSFNDGIPFLEPRELDHKFSPAKVFAPLSADSSQLAAVLAVAAGKNFVLCGPPGTGKSQTIANIIAQCVAEKKTVL